MDDHQAGWSDAAPMSPSLRRLAERGVPRAFRKGQTFIVEGSVGDEIYIVRSGRLRAFSVDPSGDREITFGHYGPGDYVGEMSLDGGERSANVAAEVATQCAMVTRRTLADHLRAEPEFAFELLAKVVRRARAATLGMKQMAHEDAYGRLRLWLLQHAQPGPDGTLVVDPMSTHREIASEIGCTRERVSRLLGDLRPFYLEIRDGVAIILRPLPPRF